MKPPAIDVFGKVIDSTMLAFRVGRVLPGNYGSRNARHKVGVMGEKQLKLFGGAAALPEGFRYEPDIISPEQELRVLRQADDIPPFLLSLREAAAGFGGMSPSQLQQVLVTEYDAGAGIGWHRDKAIFGEVIGISLVSACRFRLRRKVGAGWERAAIIAEPRSAYLLSGPSRAEWEHSIPQVDTLRYSVTFRNFCSAS